jgi:beta-phosphoglucomutase-like phosphatase (HAD superfamily)
MHAASEDPRVGAVAVCTGSRLAEAELQLRATGVWGLLKGCITRESVTRIKPDPEPYLRACECVGMKPRECVTVEDTVPGIRSARAAGVRVAAVCHTLPAGMLGEADRVFESTAQIRVDDLLAMF